MRTIIASIADSHAGSKYSLCNPDALLYDRDSTPKTKPTMTASSTYLWDIYQEMLGAAFEFANDDEMVLLHNGDATHGIHFKSELVSTAAADQIIIAVANLTPWYTYPHLTHGRIITGTGVHIMGEGSSEILIAELLAGKYPKVDTQVKTHGLLTINGVVVDVAHHGPQPGSREWLKGNVARFYLRDLMLREVIAHRTPPRLVLRAHYHNPVHEYLELNGCVSDLYILPSMSLLDEHAQKTTQSTHLITNGVTLFEIIDGEIASTKRLYKKLDVRQCEVI